MNDRRNFLKIFGVTSAAVASAGEITTEHISAEEVKVLKPHSYNNSAEWNKENVERFSVKWFDCVRESLYSKVVIGKNSMESRHDAFRYSADGEHTVADTNLFRVSSLCAPEAFMVRRIGVVFSPATLPAARAIFSERYAMTFWIGNRRYFQCPLAMSYTVNENPSDTKAHEAFFDIGELPLIIDHQISFHMDFVGTPLAPNPKIAFWAVLDGIMARGIC